MHDQLTFASWLRQRRKALDLTQAQLAQQASCSLSALPVAVGMALTGRPCADPDGRSYRVHRLLPSRRLPWPPSRIQRGSSL